VIKVLNSASAIKNKEEEEVKPHSVAMIMFKGFCDFDSASANFIKRKAKYNMNVERNTNSTNDCREGHP
jgi:hypothetical protein